MKDFGVEFFNNQLFSAVMYLPWIGLQLSESLAFPE